MPSDPISDIFNITVGPVNPGLPLPGLPLPGLKQRMSPTTYTAPAARGKRVSPRNPRSAHGRCLPKGPELEPGEARDRVSAEGSLRGVNPSFVRGRLMREADGHGGRIANPSREAA